MDQEIYHLPKLNKARSAVEIVVHVSENLGDEQRKNLVVALEQEDGIVSAEFCPQRYHLMLVKYDRAKCASQAVLRAISAQKIEARLIGPI
jgi:hypothetical protein